MLNKRFASFLLSGLMYSGLSARATSDINNDGTVDSKDLFSMTLEWNGNQQNFDDLLQIKSDWKKSFLIPIPTLGSKGIFVTSSGLEGIIVDNKSAEFDFQHRFQPAIAVDENDFPLITYPSGNNLLQGGKVKSARPDSEKWFYSEIAPNGPGSYMSLGVEGSKAHICFPIYDFYGGEDLYYGVSNGPKFQNWTLRKVHNVNSNGLENDIAIDSNGKVHISQWQFAGKNIYYSTNKNGNWVNAKIGVGEWIPTAISLDSNDVPHILYESDGVLYHATNKSGNWIADEISSGYGHNPDLVIDSNDSLHALHFVSGNFVHSSNSTGVWEQEFPFDRENFDYSSTHSAVIQNDNIYSTHIRLGDLIVNSNKSGQWRQYEIDKRTSGVNNYMNPKISIDKQGNLHLTAFKEYYPEDKTELCYIRVPSSFFE